MRETILIEHDGLVLTIKEWAYRAGLSKQGLVSRLRDGMTMEAALKPNGTYRKQRKPTQQRKPRPDPCAYVPTAEERREMELCAFNSHPALGANPFPLRGSLCA